VSDERLRTHLVPLGAVLDLVTEKQGEIHRLLAERSTTRLLEAGNDQLRAELQRMGAELARYKQRHAAAANSDLTTLQERDDVERRLCREQQLLSDVVVAFRNHGHESPELARAIDAADPALRSDTTNKGDVFE
jgi:hypothetical protein